MLVPNQKIQTTWTPANRQHYIECGYEYTKMRQPLVVAVEDLTQSSHMKVKVICDYCGKEFEKYYANYQRDHNDISGKDCCNQCRPKKFTENFRAVYGVDNPFQLESAKAKSRETCLEKYGTERACQSDEVKAKIVATSMERYGVSTPLLSDEIRAKTEASCLRKFGVKNPFESKEVQEDIRRKNEERYGEGNIAHTPEISAKIKATNMERYGVPYTTQAPEVIAKMRRSLYKNGNVPSSKAEAAICQMLVDIYGADRCNPSYPLDRINMDCLLIIDGHKIDVEYDGWYWHKDRAEHDKRRNYWLIKRGYKVLRIRSNDELPTRQQIIDAVDYLVKDNHSLTYIDLDI